MIIIIINNNKSYLMITTCDVIYLHTFVDQI